MKVPRRQSNLCKGPGAGQSLAGRSVCLEQREERSRRRGSRREAEALNPEPEEGDSPWAEAARESRMGDREPSGPSDSGWVPPHAPPHEARNLRARL